MRFAPRSKPVEKSNWVQSWNWHLEDPEIDPLVAALQDFNVAGPSHQLAAYVKFQPLKWL